MLFKINSVFKYIPYSTTGKYSSVAFKWMVTLKDFLLALESQNHLVEHKQKHYSKVLLSSFHLKDFTHRLKS